MVKDWKETTLGDIAEIRMCKRIFADQTTEKGDIPFFKIGTFGKEPDAYISRALYEDFRSRYSFPSKGDVLLSAAGTLGRTVVYNGKPAYFQDSNIVWLEIDKSQICNEYLFHCYAVMKWASPEGSTIARLCNGIIQSTTISLPPLPEQRRIAAALSDMDGYVAALEKLIAKKKAIKQGVMQELLTGKRRLPGFSGEWVERNLVSNATLKARIGWQGLTTAEYLDSGYAYLVTGTDFHAGKIAWATCHYVDKSRYDQDTNIQIANGNILITKDGTIGKVAIVKGLTRKATLNSGVFVLRPKANIYDSKFVYHILLSEIFTDFLDELAAGSTIIHLYQKDFVTFEFLSPPTLAEQSAIAEILSDMDAEIDALTAKLNKARLIKQGMMQELLTGKVRLAEEATVAAPAEKPVAKIAETPKAEPKGHNQQFDDAVAFAVIVDKFAGQGFPLGRVRTNKLLRCFAEVKGDMTTGHIADLCAWVEPKVGFYIALKETIGKKSGDFLDLKSYEKDMRRLIDTYIRSEDSRKLGEFDDYTLLDFAEAQGEELKGKNKESAAEAIENNIRKKVVEKILINPRYYENMSAILDELIRQRREGVIAYEDMLQHYIDLINKSETPENNTAHYPESIRHSAAMRAFYDNCGEDEDLAVALHQAVLDSKEDQFRHNLFKEKRIKKALFAVIKKVIESADEAKNEVERIYNIVVEQEEY